jgi:C1A family cysteine protease
MKLVIFLLFLLSVCTYAEKTYTEKPTREKHSLGLKRTLKHKEFLKKAKKMSLLRETSVPGSVDLTPKVSPPEDQGSCGSCYDFSITKALRSAFMLIGQDPGRLAFNYILNNCGVVNEDGCGGGDFEAGQNDINQIGPWLESQDPYTEHTGTCKNLPPKATAVDWVSVAEHIPTFQELAIAISLNHMLSIDVAVCGSWENYSSGIFNTNECGPDSINHMINMVGYNCETSVDVNGNCAFNSVGLPKNGDGYLKVMNNWGNTWGEQGYMRTRYAMNAVADTAMYFDVKPAPEPTPPIDKKNLPWWAYGLMGALGVCAIGCFMIATKQEADKLKKF